MKLFWLKKGLGFVVLALVVITAAGWAITGLWNWLVPVLFAGPTITFIQAIGLLLLARLLVGFRGGWGGREFGGDWSHYDHPRHAFWQQKMASRWHEMTHEERQHFKQKMKEQLRKGCEPGSGRHWHQESQQTQPTNPSEPTTV